MNMIRPFYIGLRSQIDQPAFVRLMVISIVVTALIYSSLVGTAAAQQLVRPGPAPDRRQLLDEYVVPASQLYGLFALSTLWKGRPAILYSDEFVDRYGGFRSPALVYVRAHEYGHHRLRHMAVTRDDYAYNELDADCWAAEILARAGRRRAIDAGIALYWKHLPPYDQPGMPGARTRANKINDCM